MKTENKVKYYDVDIPEQWREAVELENLVTKRVAWMETGANISRSWIRVIIKRRDEISTDMNLSPFPFHRLVFNSDFDWMSAL